MIKLIDLLLTHTPNLIYHPISFRNYSKNDHALKKVCIDHYFFKYLGTYIRRSELASEAASESYRS